MRLTLLVLALIDLEAVRLLQERLPEADDVAVAGQHEHAAHERNLNPVVGDILVFKKAHQRLRHGQSDRLHASPSM